MYLPLNLDLKSKSSLSKMLMQMAVIKRAITAWMKNVRKVWVIISTGKNSEKFFAISRIDWKPG